MAEDTPTDMETKLAEMKHERCDRDSVLFALRSLSLYWLLLSVLVTPTSLHRC